MRNEVWVLVESRNQQLEAVTTEMLSEGRRLAKRLKGKICACLLGPEVEKCIDSLRDCGTEKLYLVDDDMLHEYSLDGYTYVLEKLITKYDPLLLSIGATPQGKEIAPRIAARLSLPCITEAKRLNASGETLQIAKSGFNDKAYLNLDFIPEKPVVITVLPGDMNSDAADELPEMDIIREGIEVQSSKIRTRNKKFIKGDPKKIRLQDAELIVAAGNGVDTEAFISLEAAADLLGASIGGTRPIVDKGLIPFERQIGITGKSVSPKLLIACGISGAREFTMGIENATLTIAINTDAKAPIFGVADLGIPGDVKQIIPAIIKALNKNAGRVAK